MILNKNRILVLFILLNLFYIPNGYTRKKICDIKFNVKEGVKELENKVNLQKRYKHFPGKSEFYCYQIGLEHDTNQKPISSKPIYACCQE